MSASILATGVAVVVWIIPPVPTTYGMQPDALEPARYEARGNVIRAVAATDPAHIAVIDLARWFDASGAVNDPSFRPDGLHMSDTSATWLAQQYLGPELVRLALGEPSS
jgi:hypothetical protein